MYHERRTGSTEIYPGRQLSDGDPRPVEHDADAVRAVKALLEEFL
jgi:hypothetical protein